MKKLFTILLLITAFSSLAVSEPLYAGDKLRSFSVSEDLHKNTIYLSSVKPSYVKDYFEITFYVIVSPTGTETLQGIHAYPVTFVAKKGDTLLLKNNVWSYPENIHIDEIENNSITFSKEITEKNADIEQKEIDAESTVIENLDWSEKTFFVSENLDTSKTNGEKISVQTKLQLGFIRNDKATAKTITDKEGAIKKALSKFFTELSKEELKLENRNELKIQVKNYLNENVLYSPRIIAVTLTDFNVEVNEK